jgi:hypothetical protein
MFNFFVSDLDERDRGEGESDKDLEKGDKDPHEKRDAVNHHAA